MTTDQKIRLAAFNWLSEYTRIYGDVLQRTLLAQGFLFEGQRIFLISASGIFKPKQMELPLTITTTPDSPYSDALSPDGFLLYK